MSPRIPLGKLQVLITFLESSSCHAPSCPAVWENSAHVFPTRFSSKVFSTGNWTHSGPSHLPLTFFSPFLLHLGSRGKQLSCFPQYHIISFLPRPLSPASEPCSLWDQLAHSLWSQHSQGQRLSVKGLQITSPIHCPHPQHTKTLWLFKLLLSFFF